MSAVASAIGFLVRAIKWRSIGLAKWVRSYEKEEGKGQ